MAESKAAEGPRSAGSQQPRGECNQTGCRDGRYGARERPGTRRLNRPLLREERTIKTQNGGGS